MIKTLAASLALAVIAMLAIPGVASAKTCKNTSLRAQGGNSISWTVARAKARIAWNRKARERYGVAWRLWLRAEDRNYNCKGAGARKYCIVRARACRAGGPGGVVDAPKNCKNWEVHKTGLRRNTRDAARVSARARWVERTANLYGRRWSRWRRAANRRIECRRVGGRYQCKAKARPCRNR